MSLIDEWSVVVVGINIGLRGTELRTWQVQLFIFDYSFREKICFLIIIQFLLG